jgi:hypothetical protein
MECRSGAAALGSHRQELTGTGRYVRPRRWPARNWLTLPSVVLRGSRLWSAGREYDPALPQAVDETIPGGFVLGDALCSTVPKPSYGETLNVPPGERQRVEVSYRLPESATGASSKGITARLACQIHKVKMTTFTLCNMLYRRWHRHSWLRFWANHNPLARVPVPHGKTAAPARVGAEAAGNRCPYRDRFRRCCSVAAFFLDTRLGK